MSNIVKYERFDKDGIEIVINTQTGEAFASVSGYARMANKPQSTVNSRMNNKKVPNGKLEVRKVEIQTQQGLRSIRIVTENQICEWLPKDNPAMATQLLKLGVRVFMHKLAGYEIKSTAIEQPKLPTTYLEALKALVLSVEENEELAKRNKELVSNCESLKEELVEQKPYVVLAESLVTHDVDTVNISEFAKAMGIRRNTMFENLRKIKFLQQNGRIPYQVHIESGRAEVYRKPRQHQPGYYDTVTVLTAKGQKYICKKFAELKKQEKVELQMEYVLTAEDF